MNTKVKTQALCEYFNNKPDGEYHPFIVSSELGVPSSTWRRYARLYLYPLGSDARKALAKIGVTISTRQEPKDVRDGKLYISTFVKEKIAGDG